MVTRIGSSDFGTKLKFAHESLMPGFVPFYRADLLIFGVFVPMVTKGANTEKSLLKEILSINTRNLPRAVPTRQG